MDDSESFGYWVRRRRKSLDLTQAELARRVGCAAKTIQKFEADVRRPSKVMTERLADALELAPGIRSAFLSGARSGMWGGDGSLLSRPADAPPVERPGSAGALPVPTTPLIGRAREAAAVCEVLEATPVRLVTLTGPGGVGKTRLAVQVAADLQQAFVDGVVFVNLAPIRTPDLVPTAIARALGLGDVAGHALMTHLQAALRERQLLLVLDNFEHVVAAAPVVADLLTTAPRLKVLLTSRSVVGVYGEHDIPVPPLSLPDANDLLNLDRLFQVEAIRLFVERARAARPAFLLTTANASVVGGICHYLDGLPLAIELAAARVGLLPPQALLQRLTGSPPGGAPGRLQVLTGGPRTLPARQQTLRNTLAWSYDLLDGGTQRLFGRLAVFVGGCTLEAVETVCTGDGDPARDTLAGLQALLDTSLLEQREAADGQPRFSMLETIREYALEHLEASGELERLQRRHADYFVMMAESAEPTVSGARQGRWWDRCEGEHDNFRAALAWSRMEAKGDTGLRLALALFGFWRGRGHLHEGYRWLADAVRQTEDGVPAGPSTEGYRTLRARALDMLGCYASFQGDLVGAQRPFEESLALFRDLGDCAGLAEVLADLGMTVGLRGDFGRAGALLEESLTLYRDLGHAPAIAGNLFFLGNLTYAQGHTARACELWEESRRLTSAAGAPWVIASILPRLAMVALDQGDYGRAGAQLVESLLLLREQGERWETLTVLEVCARLAAEQGQQPVDAQAGGLRAARLFGATAALRVTYGTPVLPDFQDHYRRSVAAARAHLDAATFAAAWAEGQVMTLEQAIAYALEATGPQ